MLNVMICDDDPEEVRDLERMVTDALAGASVGIRRLLTREDMEEELRTGAAPDIVLLAVRFSGDDGIRLARAFFPEGCRTQVIFVAGCEEYDAEIYEAEHVYCLFRPVREEQLRRAVEKARRRLARLDPGELTLTSRTRTFPIPLADIRYIESIGRKIAVYHLEDRTESYGTLDALNERLPDCFVRCHKSFFVNLNYVERMETERFVLKGGNEIPISQMRRRAVRKRFLEYIESGR